MMKLLYRIFPGKIFQKFKPLKGFVACLNRGRSGSTLKITVLLTLTSGLFGSGGGYDGPLEIYGDYYVDSVRTAVTGDNNAGDWIISVADADQFTSGDYVLIISMQDVISDTSQNITGNYEINVVQSQTSLTVLALDYPLSRNYYTSSGAKHQVLRIPSFTTVHVYYPGAIKAHDWDGATGGVIFFHARDSIIVESGAVITASGAGYRGGIAYDQVGNYGGEAGESIVPAVRHWNNNNNNGGGGTGYGSCGEACGAGGYGTVGGEPTGNSCGGAHGQPGDIYGSPSLVRLFLGSGGGGGNRDDGGCNFTSGSSGGGIVDLESPVIIINGSVEANGSAAVNTSSSCDDAIGGPGSGGSIYINSLDVQVNGNLQAVGGAPAYLYQPNIYTGTGGDGRIRVNYEASYNGQANTNPSPYTSQQILLGFISSSIGANFSASIYSGYMPLTVQFTDFSYVPDSLSITSWTWQFGDGNSSSEQNPSNIFTQAGNYSVSLEIDVSNDSLYSTTKSNYIKVRVEPWGGSTHYVSTAGSNITGDGSESNPYATIQYAMDLAVDGYTVQVAAGTYVENINFNGKNISVIGADQATTIIDGDSSKAVVMFRNGETRSALLQNFTITNGNASNSSVSYGDGGGGIHIRYSSPTLKDLIVTNNDASDYGGGVAI
jgi:PKD repeat protein